MPEPFVGHCLLQPEPFPNGHFHRHCGLYRLHGFLLHERLHVCSCYSLQSPEESQKYWVCCHGISGAAGKAGAIVGAFGFLYAAQSTDPNKVDHGYPTGIGVKNSLIMLGVINFFGMVFTLLVPESKGKSLGE